MFSNIAIDLLKTLSKEELKKFELFINSPYFNTNAAIIKLFEAIKKHAPDYTDKNLHREKLFKKIYPEKAYNETSLRTRMSEMTDLIRKFFAVSRLEKNEFEFKLNIIQEVKQRNKFKLAEKYILEELSKLENKQDGEINYYSKLSLVKELVEVYRTSKMRNYSDYSVELGDSLFNFFYREFFAIANEIAYDKEVFNYKPEYDVTEEFIKTFNVKKFLETAKEKNYMHFPYLALFYYMHIVRTDYGNEENFYNLKELALNYHKNLSRAENNNIWSALINSINGGLRYKDAKYMREAFELNKFFLGLEIMPLEPGGYFYPEKFYNIFTIATGCKEFDFAERFAEENYKKVPPEVMDNIINLCRGIIQFFKKNYSGSIDYLNKVELNDIVVKIRARMYYFMNYYETNSFESANSLLDSFKHFISENKDVPDLLVNGIKQWLKYASNITNAKMNMKKLDYAVYKEAKDLNTNFWSKNWFIEKMEELI